MQGTSGVLVTPPNDQKKDTSSSEVVSCVEDLQPPLQRTKSTTSFADNASEYSEVILRPHNADQRKVITASYAPSMRPGSQASSYQGGPKHKSRQKGNMVLQLVIPNNFSSDPMDSHNNRSATPVSIANEFRNHQLKPSNYYGQDLGTQQDGGLVNRFSKRPPSQCSTLPSPDHHHGISTAPEEKRKLFSNTLTNSLSIIYALFNVTVGLMFYTNRIIDPAEQAAEGFSIFLVGGSFLFILYILIDVTIFMRTKTTNEQILETSGNNNIEITQVNGQFQFKIDLPPVKRICHDYCFNMDRHSSNFFLKIGAAAFCIGHLIHSGLLLGYRIAFWTTEERRNYNCTSIPTMIIDVLYPVYSFLLLFFVFKYSNIIINKNTVIARFGIMHCLSASLCFWVWTIVREILEAISVPTITPTDPTNLQNGERMRRDIKGTEIDFLSNTTHLSNITLKTFTRICDQVDDNLSKVYKNFSPYLYPFSVEYSILVVGVLYLVWLNIAICEDIEEHSDGHHPSTKQCQNSGRDVSAESNVTVHVDCHSSNKGLFLGFVIVIMVLVSSIVFFIAVYGSVDQERGKNIGLFTNVITSLFILALMMVATVFGYYQITKLDITTGHHNLLDDFLLIICMPAFFLSSVFSMVPAVYFGNVLKCIEIILELLQVVVQTVFIIDGIRRSSNCKKLMQRKYGRELVTFLILANISLWLMQTMEVKAKELTDQRYEYYGKTVWSIVGHICLPLIMFYRFHAAVCFGDMWKYCYEPAGH